MTDPEKLTLMAETVKPITDLIATRLQTRVDALLALAGLPLDTGVPESVKLKREEESSKIRAVVQELKDLQAIIKVLYPDG